MANVPVTRTTFTTKDYARAVLRAWRAYLGVYPSKEAVGCLWAQYALETGRGAFCFNHNIGNVKHTPPRDYMMLRGTWEIVNGKRVVFEPPHPATWFNAYASLDDAMLEHLKLLRERRYASAWPAVEAGQPGEFAIRLKNKGYYTAPMEDYARGLRGFHQEFMRMPAYENALDEIIADAEVDTQPELRANPASEPTVYVLPQLNTPILGTPIVRVDPSVYLGNGEPPDDDAA